MVGQLEVGIDAKVPLVGVEVREVVLFLVALIGTLM